MQDVTGRVWRGLRQDSRQDSSDPLGLFAGQPGSDAPPPFNDAEMAQIYDSVARGLNQQLSDEMNEPPAGVYRPRDIDEVKLKIREMNAKLKASDVRKKASDALSPEEYLRNVNERKRLKRLLTQMQSQPRGRSILRSSMERPYQFQKGNRGRTGSPERRQTQKRTTSTGPTLPFNSLREAREAARKLMEQHTREAGE